MISRYRKMAPVMSMLVTIPVLAAQGTDESRSVQTAVEKLVAILCAWGIKMNTAGTTLDLE